MVSRCSPPILPQYESVNGPSYLHSAIFTGKVDFVITARVSRKGRDEGHSWGGNKKETFLRSSQDRKLLGIVRFRTPVEGSG